MRMRPANDMDSNLLFAWRNDPVTQAASRSTAPISREDHDRWMKFNVQQGYPQHLVVMAETDAGSVGVIRFDATHDTMAFDVSLTIAPRARRTGVAVAVLAQAISYMDEFRLNAEIRRENIASRRVFESCGFEEIGREGGFLNFRREPVR